MNKREYTAIFAIGGKLLGSFKGAMNMANARLAKLRATTVAFGKTITKLTAGFGGLAAIIASFGISKILGSLFSGATEQAKEARQRIQATIASFLQLKEIAAKGPKAFEFAKAQLDNIYKMNEALGKQGVLHSDIYNEMTKQMAIMGVPPRQIKASMEAFGDLLVALRGVTATEQDAFELANAVGRAVHGKTKGMVAFGMFIDAKKTLADGRKVQKSYQEIFEEILLAAQGVGIKGAAVRGKDTPEGKIVVLQNRLQDLREQIGDKILPVQAKMAEAWLKMLSDENVKLLQDGLDWIYKQLTRLVDYVVNEVLPWLRGTEGQRWLKKMADGFKWVVQNAKWLVPTILGIVAALWALQAVTLAVNAVAALAAAPWVLVGLAIAALVGLIIWAIVNWKSFRDTVLGVIETMEEWINQIPVIGPMLNLFLFGPLKAIIKVIDWIVQNWPLIGKTISDTWDAVKDHFIRAWSFMKDHILGVIAKIKGAWTKFWNWFTGLGGKEAAAYGQTVSTGQAGGAGGYGGVAGAAAAAAPLATASRAAAAQMPLSPEGLAAVQAERASIVEEMRRPELRNLISATLATEAGDAEDQKNVLEALVNRAAAAKQRGAYQGIEAMIKGGFYGPYNRGETAAVMAKGLSDARAQQVGGFIDELAKGRNALGGLTDQGMANEIQGAIKERVGEDYYGLQNIAGETQTAAYRASRGYQFGGIARTPQLATLAEKGPEMVLPLKGAGGIGGTNVNFAPTITINGNASEQDQQALMERLRSLSREFIERFKQAQYQERRLSFESGYG